MKLHVKLLLFALLLALPTLACGSDTITDEPTVSTAVPSDEEVEVKPKAKQAHQKKKYK